MARRPPQVHGCRVELAELDARLGGVRLGPRELALELGDSQLELGHGRQALLGVGERERDPIRLGQPRPQLDELGLAVCDHLGLLAERRQPADEVERTAELSDG